MVVIDWQLSLLLLRLLLLLFYLSTGHQCREELHIEREIYENAQTQRPQEFTHERAGGRLFPVAKVTGKRRRRRAIAVVVVVIVAVVVVVGVTAAAIALARALAPSVCVLTAPVLYLWLCHVADAADES